jgi:hypothetical protein
MLAALGWSDWLAIGAFAISLLSVGFTYRADRRADRAERRAQRAEHREVERHTREEEQADEARRARFALTPIGSSSEGGGRHHYQFTVRNIGAAPAHELEAWLVNEQSERLSAPAPSPRISLTQGEVSAIIVTTHVVDPSDLVIVLSWTDAAGPHEWSSGVSPTRG